MNDAQKEILELRESAEALAEALEAITRDDCMTLHGETGSWIDTEAPARIAEGALDAYRAKHPKTQADPRNVDDRPPHDECECDACDLFYRRPVEETP